MAVWCDLEVDVNSQWSRDFHGDEPNEEETIHAQPKTKQCKKLFGFVNKQAVVKTRSSRASDHRRHGFGHSCHSIDPCKPKNHYTRQALRNVFTIRHIEKLVVNYVLGGVARNVAECMSKLGAKPYMISALGLDMAGDFAFYFVVS
ncbi:hypothetical protein CUMW_249520 [Citrus unshiu]|uniref:Uncharacterized protein n=1 Tax=Citrus unshiu TaxID=55188 RepID=A0A2H5QPN0_CITUN|nr:hypothetical protein CUMW_249520 [Citrus unshiu]